MTIAPWPSLVVATCLPVQKIKSRKIQKMKPAYPPSALIGRGVELTATFDHK